MNTERLMFLAGLVVGEGSFCVSFVKRKSIPRGFGCRVKFTVTMGETDGVVLEEVCEEYGIGSISVGSGRNARGKQWSVSSEDELKQLVDMFQQIRQESSLFRRSRKAESFELFRQAVDERYAEEPDWEKLVRLAVQMNESSAQRGRTEEEMLELVS